MCTVLVHNKTKHIMLQVTSREFRDKQAALLNMADQGEQVIIRRRGKRSYMLTSIQDDDLDISPQLKKKIEEGRKQYKNGETISFKNAEEAVSYLESL